MDGDLEKKSAIEMESRLQSNPVVSMKHQNVHNLLKDTYPIGGCGLLYILLKYS